MNVAHHYDISDELYFKIFRSFEAQYSCGILKKIMTLEQPKK